MRFLIYIPSVQGDVTPKDEQLAKVGLPAFAHGCSSIATAAGPDRRPGVVFSWEQPGVPRSVMGYLPDGYPRKRLASLPKSDTGWGS